MRRMTLGRVLGLSFGLAAFVLLLVLDTPLATGAGGPRAARAAAVALLMGIWWLTEALPIYWTACVPLVAFPLLGIFPGSLFDNLASTVLPYLHPYIFLFAGGMAIAAAMQQWGLHRRIALTVMAALGTHPGHLLGGFLVATAFVSGWISNTATATMMLPIGLAVLLELETALSARERAPRRLDHYGMALMLAIAYGANIGGIGTKIGTAPNTQLAGFAERIGIDISFIDFLAIGMPFVALFLPIAWVALWWIGHRDCGPGGLASDLGATVIARERGKLGSMRAGERLVLAVAFGAAAGWIAGRPLTAWLKSFPALADVTSAQVEGGVAVLAALSLLALRSGGGPVLAPRSLTKVPWETLLLLGGSFALAAGIQESGLSTWMADQMGIVRELPGFQQVLLAALVTVGISAVASNTATMAVMLVVLKDAVAPEVLPIVLFAATIAASCDFALPVGTPPNAIVFGSGYVTIPRMFRVGVALDLLAALLAAAWCWLAVPRVL